MANRYSKALKHIRGKKNLSEAPTNSLSGVYALNKPGTRLGPPPKDGKIFLPDIDGNYPPGIPGTPGEPFYKRGDGYWSGERDWDTITTPSFANSDAGGNGQNTSTLIDDATGVVLTGLPPNSRHFILGPLVDGYVYNHGSDAFTNIGYIQKDTRQFVLLARVNGQWVDNLSTFETYGWGIGRTWDGLEPSFYAYNPEFTYEMAKWYQKEVAEGRYVNNVAYFYSGGVGQPGLGGNAPAPGMYGGTGVGAGGDGSEANSTGSGFGYGSGGEPTIGTAENETPGGPEEAGFPWGLGQLWDDLKDKAEQLWDNIKDKAGDIVDNVGEFLGEVFDNAQDMAEGAADLSDSLGEAINNAIEGIDNYFDDLNIGGGTSSDSSSNYPVSGNTATGEYVPPGQAIGHATTADDKGITDYDPKDDKSGGGSGLWDGIKNAVNVGQNIASMLWTAAEIVTGAKAGEIIADLTFNPLIDAAFGFGTADSVGEYNTTLATSLMTSVVTGKNQQIKLGKNARADLVNSIDPSALADALVLGPPPDITSDNAINPNPGKSDKVLTGNWGAQGGVEVHYNPDNGSFTVTAVKMLRDFGDLDQKNADGKITNFEDIPNPSSEQIKNLFASKGMEGPLKSFYNMVANADIGGLVGDGVSIKPFAAGYDPEEAAEIMYNGLPEITKALYNFAVEGSASNAVHLRDKLTQAGISQSEIEQAGAGFGGYVYSQEQYFGGELPQSVKNVINKKMDVYLGFATESRIRSVRSVIREQAAQAPTVDASSTPGEVNSSIIKNTTDKFASEYVKNHGVEKAQKLKDDTEAFMQEQDIPTNEERATPPEPLSDDVFKDEGFGFGGSPEEFAARKAEYYAKELARRTNYLSHDIKGLDNWFNQVQWFVGNVVESSVGELLKSVGITYEMGKVTNNISIARSILTGEVVDHAPTDREMMNFAASIQLHDFIDYRGNKPKLKISTAPVPYSDDNIYLDENGKVHVNHGEYAPLANEEWGYKYDKSQSLAGHGKGYAQMIIPQDGSNPYIRYVDYNYHNLNSSDESEVPDKMQEILSSFVHMQMKIEQDPAAYWGDMSNYLGKSVFQYKQVLDSLKDKPGLPGWPKGIHGAAKTQFDVPLEKLPEDIQKMIKSHPLYWTKDRVANLPLEERVPLYKSVDVKDPEVQAYFNESFDRIIKDHPELKENWDASGRAYKQRRELLEKKRVGNDPATQVKIDAAYKALQDAQWGEDGVRWSSLPEEDQFKMAGVSHKEYTKLREKVQGYRHRFDYANQQVDYLASVAETDKLTQLYTTYNQIQQNAYAPIKGMNDALGVVDGQIKGTEQQRQQYQKLVSDYRKAYEEMMVHFRARQAQMMKTSQIHQNYMNEYDNTWKQASQMFNQVQSTLKGKIDELRRVWEVAKTNGVDGINKRLKELEQEIKELGERNEPLAKAFDDDYLHDFLHWSFSRKGAYGMIPTESWTNPRMAPTSVDDGYGGSGPAEPSSSPDEPVQDDPTYGGADAATAAVMAGARKKRYEEYKKKYESELLEEDKLHILKEIKKPVEVCEVPFQKLRKYKPNFVGKFTPQNVPSAVASHQSDKLVDRANARGQTWRSENRYWQGYETVERMNLIQDRLGHGNQAWEKIIDEARNKNGWKNREIQEHLNIIAHTKAMKDMNPEYEDPFTYLQLQEMGNAEPAKDPIGDEKRENELGTYLKDPLVKRVAKKVKSTLDYKDKPAKKGYPDKEPPKMEKGWHPQFGKGKEGYYSKLDPQSANAMPPQEDEVIDKQVEKAKTKPELDTIPFRDSLFKKLATLRDKQKKELTNA